MSTFNAYAAITYTLSPEIPDNKLQAITNAMDGTMEQYNLYSDYNKNIWVYYSSGIPTAQASFNGPIGFGGSISEKTAIHEMCHVMGVGVYSGWDDFTNSSTYEGYYGVHVLRVLYDDENKKFGGDNSHIWPQGFNFNYENPKWHVILMGAIRRDLGLSDNTKAEYAVVQDIKPRYYLIRHIESGLYLRPVGRAGEDGFELAIFDLTPGDEQFHWEAFTPGHGYYTFINKETGSPVRTFNGQTDNDTRLTNTGGLSSTRWESYQWEIKPEGNFEQRKSLRSMQPLGGSTSLGARVVIQDTVLGASTQQWELVEVVNEAVEPTGLTAVMDASEEELSMNEGKVNLNWDALSLFDLEGYHVYRAMNSVGLFTRITDTPITTNAFVDTTPQSNERYYYKVTAVSATAESAMSNETFVVMQPVIAEDDFEAGGFGGGSGWTGRYWDLSGEGPEILTLSGNEAAKMKKDGTISRTLRNVSDNGILAFMYDIDNLDSGETVIAEIYDGTWHTVWSEDNSANGSDSQNNDNNVADDLQPHFVDLAGYTNVTSVRFATVAGGTWDVLFIDDVSITGDVDLDVSSIVDGAQKFQMHSLSNFEISVGKSLVGYGYQLQTSTVLPIDSWDNAGPLIPGDGSTISFDVDIDTVLDPQCYFRVLVVPQ